jgi:hypothetical protein
MHPTETETTTTTTTTTKAMHHNLHQRGEEYTRV